MSESVNIPHALFNQTIELLESLDSQDFDPIFACRHRYVLYSFLLQKQRSGLRNVHTGQVCFCHNQSRSVEQASPPS